MTNNNGVSKQDLNKWLEAQVVGTIDGKELTKEDEKLLKRLSKKQVSLVDATAIAETLAKVSTFTLSEHISELFGAIEVLTTVLQDELGVTDEQFEKSASKIQSMREEILKEQQEQVRKEQEKETEDDSSEKVIQLNPHD